MLTSSPKITTASGALLGSSRTLGSPVSYSGGYTSGILNTSGFTSNRVLAPTYSQTSLGEQVLPGSIVTTAGAVRVATAAPVAIAATTGVTDNPGAKCDFGKDAGANALGNMTSYQKCVMAEYIWLDAHQVPRSKTKVLTARPRTVADCPIWNFDGSSTEQAEGSNSEINIIPRALFDDPFRGYPHVMVVTDCYNAWDDQPAIGNTRAACVEVHEYYKDHDPWYGIEQEYTLMKPGRVGEKSRVPYGFNADGSEPGPQGPYYTGAGTGIAIGRPVADEHIAKCLAAGVKIAGLNAEVMPGQWEYQIGPCRGVEIGDHMAMSRYIMLRVTESQGMEVSFDPKPMDGDWNGAGCHTNFSVKVMREAGGIYFIKKVCEAFGRVTAEHIAEYGEGNDKRLTGLHETCSITQFKYGVADRGASIRIPRTAEQTGKGYMEDRRPAANCDPYRVAARIMETTGWALSQ